MICLRDAPARVHASGVAQVREIHSCHIEQNQITHTHLSHSQTTSSINVRAHPTESLNLSPFKPQPCHHNPPITSLPPMSQNAANHSRRKPALRPTRAKQAHPTPTPAALLHETNRHANAPAHLHPSVTTMAIAHLPASSNGQVPALGSQHLPSQPPKQRAKDGKTRNEKRCSSDRPLRRNW